MPFVTETKRAYCSVCGCETEWEYVLVQRADGYFGLLNAIDPTSHQVKFWRCLNHSTLEGRIKPEFHKSPTHRANSFAEHRR